MFVVTHFQGKGKQKVNSFVGLPMRPELVCSIFRHFYITGPREKRVLINLYPVR